MFDYCSVQLRIIKNRPAVYYFSGIRNVKPIFKILKPLSNVNIR